MVTVSPSLRWPMLSTARAEKRRLLPRRLVQALADVARERGASRIVLGLPKNMNGTEGESASAVRQLADRLVEAGLVVTFWDERLSSWEAESRLKDGGGIGRSKGRVDRAAAALLLQAFLDKNRREEV